MRQQRIGRTASRGIGVLAIVVAALIAGLATPAEAGTRLRVVDLGTLGDVCCSEATALNDNGVVVGNSNVGPPMSARHAFRWHHGRMVDLGTLGGNNSGATGINKHGDIVGYSDLANGTTHAVLWHGGRKIDLGTLGGDASYATGINDSGVVVGYSAVAGSFGQHAFSWHDGKMTDLGLLTGDGFAHAYAVNNRGQVVGDASVDVMNNVPVRWQQGTPSRLILNDGAATAINDRGQIAGFIYGNGAFLWSDGRVVMGTLPGAYNVAAHGINNRGAVVGSTQSDAFLWQHGHMTTLPRLKGSTTGAFDINNRGQIVGLSATNPDGTNPHAVLWTR